MQETFQILAIDDEPFNLELIEALFQSYENVTIESALSGKEGLQKLHNANYDVILLDISMPEMDGLEVLQVIRATPKLSHIPVLMLTANSEKELEALTLGANDFLQKPYNVEILCVRTLNYAKMSRYQQQINNQKAILQEEVAKRTKELHASLELAKKTEYEISVRLGRASEFRDVETGGHIKRMSLYSQLLASLYGLDEEECELILYAAPLHDIGKVAIPDKILLKPGRFSDDEFAIMKNHAAIGAAMLQSEDSFAVLEAGRIIALQHHEKWDGTGYPHGKKGEEIHLYARIVAIADVFDALSSARCYKEAFEFDRVITIMQEESGKHFDPELLALFLKNVDQFIAIGNTPYDEQQISKVVQLIKGIEF